MSKKALAQKVMADIVRLSRELGYIPNEEQYLTSGGAFSKDTIDLAFSSYNMGLRAAGLKPADPTPDKEEKREPKILLFDLETSGILVRVFGLFGNDRIGVNQIVEGTHLLSFAAKFLGDPKIFYMDQRKEPVLTDDSKMLKVLWNLLLEADVVVSQNGKGFDEKIAVGRMIQKGLPPLPKLKHMDTLLMSRRFKFDSHKLEHMAKILDVPVKKLMNRKYIGMELWNQCIAGNPEAWAEMKEYNCADVLSLEGVYQKLMPWGVPVNLNAFHNENEYRCQCGSIEFEKKDFERTPTGKYLRMICKKCGAWHFQGGAENNYLSGPKKSSMKTPKPSP